jgi:archaellum biogenesis ATPase FlaH
MSAPTARTDSWLDYWKLEEHPFQMLELSYKFKDAFDRRFYRTPEAVKLEVIIQDIMKKNIGGAYLVEGDYGSGKSTLLNYAARYCTLNCPTIVPVYAKVQYPDQITDVKECFRTIDSAMYSALRELLEYTPNSVLIEASEQKYKEVGERLKWVVKALKAQQLRVAFLVDEFDKVQSAVAQKYVSSYQTRGEVFWLEGHVTFWSAHSDWELLQNVRYSFIDGSIQLPRWGQQAIVDLIDTRIRGASQKRRGVLDIFEAEALDELWGESHGQPRKAQRIAEESMKLAASGRFEKVTRTVVGEVRETSLRSNLYQRLSSRLSESARGNNATKQVYSSLMRLISQNHDIVVIVSYLCVHNQIDTEAGDRTSHNLMAELGDRSKALNAFGTLEQARLITLTKLRNQSGVTRRTMIPSVGFNSLLYVLYEETRREAEKAGYSLKGVKTGDGIRKSEFAQSMTTTKEQREWILREVRGFLEYQLMHDNLNL